MKRSLLILLAAGAMAQSPSEQPAPLTAQPHQIRRAAMAAMEKLFDQRLQRTVEQEPFDILENTIGVYLDGYGAVFTGQVNLIYSPTINPFRITMSKQDITNVHNRKLKQLPLLKQNMREMLLASSASLDGLRPTDQIALGVNLFYYNWEDMAGLPWQILMRGEKQKLLDVQFGRAPRTELDKIVRIEEF